MRPLLDALRHAAVDCLRLRVIGLSLVPVVVLAIGMSAAVYWLWHPAQAWAQHWIDLWPVFDLAESWLGELGLPGLKTWLAPVLVVAVATPAGLVMALLTVALSTTPAILRHVARHRFATLERKHGGSTWASVAGGLAATAMALGALLVTLPLWLSMPPLALLVPPLIWGWLTYRVIGYDVLSEHASASERHEILRRHRPALLLMGVLTGYLGAAPSLLWASGLFFLALSPVMIPLGVWLHTLVFVFSSLWFAHYALQALSALRLKSDGAPAASTARRWPR